MKKGDLVDTPRFCRVKISKVFTCQRTAAKYGFTEPTHYTNCEYDVFGKITELNTMIFAAARRG